MMIKTMTPQNTAIRTEPDRRRIPFKAIAVIRVAANGIISQAGETPQSMLCHRTFMGA